jgi:uncharacterized membrane protein
MLYVNSSAATVQAVISENQGFRGSSQSFHWTIAIHSLRSRVVTRPRTIGNMIAPWRFLMFVGALIVASIAATKWFGDAPLGIMAGFDLAAALFLILSIPLLWIRDPIAIEELAKANDANRTFLLVVTGIVMAVLMVAVGAEAVGKTPEPVTKIIIVATLLLAWIFSNTVYALHYAHIGYITPAKGCEGLEFPNTSNPIYWDFVYFAFTLGMTFQTSDVSITSPRIRRIVTLHCLAAFFFNIGILAFTINVLGSA